MNRLTERDKFGKVHITELSDNNLKSIREILTNRESNLLSDMLNKLAEYEDAEEQRRLIRMPCKVGDTVYILAGSSREHMLPNKYEQEKCEGFYIGDDNIAQIRVSHQKENHATYGVMNETVFLTREEAEKALKKLRIEN